MKIGILFGGPSREREISFAGGRTVYDNLNKSLFEAVPIFVDSFRNFVLLDWSYVYKGSIRDFYPPQQCFEPSERGFQLYAEHLNLLTKEEQNALLKEIGTPLSVDDLKNHIDFAFLALHGEFGEDGSIQGLLESQQIPYSGSGILPSSVGMNKGIQKQFMKKMNLPTPAFFSINRQSWVQNKVDAYDLATKQVHFPLVVRPANQGSSIGVQILKEANQRALDFAINKAFFIEQVQHNQWNTLDDEEKLSLVEQLVSIQDGPALPATVNNQVIYHPDVLFNTIEQHFSNSTEPITIEGHQSESEVIIEGFIDGKEFSCIVVNKNGQEAIALPPTEIIKGDEVFDYRHKYLAGLTRKITPINLPDAELNNIRKACEALFEAFQFHCYARIDGFIQSDGTIYLNDPNTTSGMLPSSFFFHQAAEIGLNPSQFLTFIVRTSLQERIQTQPNGSITYLHLLHELDEKLNDRQERVASKKQIAVILGGESAERHISVESGRNIYEKLASSSRYEPIPIFLTYEAEVIRMYHIPINLLLKDNADDIKEKIKHYSTHPMVEEIKAVCSDITNLFSGEHAIEAPQEWSFAQLAEQVDGVFLALHGRPGEDGTIQKELRKYNLPYNGSDADASQITINKFETKVRLKNAGFIVAKQFLLDKAEWHDSPNHIYDDIEVNFGYPLIAKPVDDGCSAAVKKIDSREELAAYCASIFRTEELLAKTHAETLQLQQNEEFPIKDVCLIEELITANGAEQFLEVTGGMLTTYNPLGEIQFEVFEPSESLATEAVLSLEEKFLAGQGQNITPARFGTTKEEYAIIAKQVKADLKHAAEVIGVKGYCRIDAFVRIFNDKSVETVIIEINSLPGMTPATCIFHQAAINGYKPYQFIDKILAFGFQDSATAVN